MLSKVLLTTTFMILLGHTTYAGCGISGGSIRILSNDFPALHAVIDAAEKCAGDGVTFRRNQTKEHRNIQVAALTANPAEFTSAIVANSSIVPLLNDGLIRPLDALVAKHGRGLKKHQLITINGKIMAVAFMANAQHLYYRKDILARAGVGVPTSYDEVLSAANAITAKGIMDYPFALNTKKGWNLGEEFVNMYLGYKGQLFKPGSAVASVNNAKGVAALKMIKSLTIYSNPDFLTFDSNATQALWEGGKLALATMWGSRGGNILDDKGSTSKITSNTVLAGAPTVGGGSNPATTLWWDGFTIAKNISDKDAKATFIAMMKGISTEMVRANNDAA
ncbi:MAG: extracellular solute-binding protein, partial [Candidatus Marinimicrobia bacterium]|nr:extracellular solute-binding protein [Candidatus Neomarinimicrobiota bacterium]